MMTTDLKILVAPTPTEMELTVKEFIIAKRQAGRSKQTIDKYQEVLRPFCDWLACEGVVSPDQITRQLARRWGASLYDHGLRPATIRQRTASIRSFLGWCWEERLLDEDLRHVLRLPVVKMQPQRTLTYDEIITLLADCDDSPTGIRNRAIINILLDTGLRASELCALQVENITFGVKFITPEGTVEVNRVETVVKGGHVGVGWFADETAQTLRAWLAVRERVNLFSRPEVFFSLGGNTPFKPLTSAGLRATLRKLGEAVGVEGVTTHAFRRSMACLCEEAGASSRKVAEYGRWSSLDLVQRYTQAYQAGRQFSKYSPVNYLARTQNEGAGDDH